MYTALQSPCALNMHRRAHTHTHTHTAGTAQGRSRAGARAELILLLGCLEMIQAILAAPRGDIGYLNLTGGVRNRCSIFTHLFLCIFNKQGQFTFRTTLGSRKMIIFIKKELFLGKRLEDTLCPCQARVH